MDENDLRDMQMEAKFQTQLLTQQGTFVPTHLFIFKDFSQFNFIVRFVKLAFVF